jgi:hypothetical protein
MPSVKRTLKPRHDAMPCNRGYPWYRGCHAQRQMSTTGLPSLPDSPGSSRTACKRCAPSLRSTRRELRRATAPRC